MRDKSALEQGGIRCGQCRRDVDEFTAIAEKWGYWSDGVLVAFCPDCSRREFSPDARASGSSSAGPARGANRG